MCIKSSRYKRVQVYVHFSIWSWLGFFSIFVHAYNKAGSGGWVFCVSRGKYTMWNAYVFFSTVHERIRKHNISPVPQLAYTFSIIFSIMGTVKECDRVKLNEVNVSSCTYMFSIFGKCKKYRTYTPCTRTRPVPLYHEFKGIAPTYLTIPYNAVLELLFDVIYVLWKKPIRNIFRFGKVSCE